MIEVLDFKEFRKNTMRGFVTMRLIYVGLEISYITLHEKNGREWLTFPAKPYAKSDGQKGWMPVLKFSDAGKLAEFQEQGLKALSAYRKRQTERNTDHDP